jgi:hypothetical protein
MAGFQSGFGQGLAWPKLPVSQNFLATAKLTPHTVTFALQGWTAKRLFVYYVCPASGRLTNQSSRRD